MDEEALVLLSCVSLRAELLFCCALCLGLLLGLSLCPKHCGRSRGLSLVSLFLSLGLCFHMN